METRMIANFHMLLGLLSSVFTFSNRNAWLMLLEFNAFLVVNSSQGFDGLWG